MGNLKFSIFIILIWTLFFSAGCVGAESSIDTEPITGKDGSVISAEEREMVRAVLPYLEAITNKDIAAMMRIYPGLEEYTTEQKLSEGLAPVKSYTLQGIEDAFYDNGVLSGVALYSIEFIKPGSLARNIAPCKAKAKLIRRKGEWKLIQWEQIKEQGGRKNFVFIFDTLEKAEKRYGTKDLSTWDGL